MRGVQVKLWDPLRMRAIPERLRGVFTTRRYTFTYLQTGAATDVGTNPGALFIHPVMDCDYFLPDQTFPTAVPVDQCQVILLGDWGV